VRFTRTIAGLVLGLTITLVSTGCAPAGRSTPDTTLKAGSSSIAPPTPQRVEDLALQLTNPTDVRLTWSKPDLNGGSDVVRYGVATYVVLGGTKIFYHYAYVNSTAGTTTYSVPGLETGTAYAFAVKAYNSNNRDANYGNVVTTTTGVTDTDALPARSSLTFVRPTDVEGELGESNKDQELTFQWTKPGTNGGYGIAHYELERRDYRDGGWHLVDYRSVVNPAQSVQYVYRPLAGGTKYEVRVRAATTESATSAWSDFSIHTVYRVDRPPAAPAAPTESAKTATTVSLRIDRPATNGGYYIDRYWVTAEQYEAGAWVRTSHTIHSSEKSSLTAVVTHLRADTKYRFRVSAVNYLGDEGPQSGNLTVTTTH